VHEFQFTCPEPDGEVIRTVRPLASRDILRVYLKIRGSLESRGRTLPFELALREFDRMDKLYWTVDDVGLLIATEAGDVHIFFWDRRLRGREQMCKTMANVVMNILDREYIWTRIPVTERAVIAFAKRIGFEQENATNGWMYFRMRRQHGS
jgi:hypothetical protein